MSSINLKLNYSKLKISNDEISLNGYVISKVGIRLSRSRLSDIRHILSFSEKNYNLAKIDTLPLDSFDEKWSSKYPKIAISWRANWANLSTYFKHPEAVRTLIYTTNTIEGFNRQLRKVTKNKSVFPTDDSLLKMLYLAMIDITKKWTGKRKDWGQIHSQLEIFFADRLPQ